MDFVADLQRRGLVNDLTEPELGKLMQAEPMTFYVGFDPTGESLHIGNMVPIMSMVRAQRAGHRPIAVVGGATGIIGDPSGRSSERNLLDQDVLARNQAGIQRDLERLLDFTPGPSACRLVNNYDWLGKFGFIEFLRDVAKDFQVGMMLGKDSVRSRLASDSGISFTEFSYMLLQSYDFLHLYREYGCKLQMGGSDQWGNITAGTELIRKKTGGRAFGMTLPLILDSSGKKFGKSTGGAVCMSDKVSSHFDFYQYFVRTSDADVLRYLGYFTLLDDEALAGLKQEVQTRPEAREAQKVLASEVTRMVRGAEGLHIAERATQVLFGKAEVEGFDDATLRAIFRDVPHATQARSELEAGIPLIEALVAVGLAKSNGAARRLIQGGGVSVNNKKCAGGQEGLQRRLTSADLASESAIVLRSGKKNYGLLVLA